MNPLVLVRLESLPDLLTDDQVIFESKEKVEEINWKLTAEATLEGYHIKPTHPESFFPYGYDNLNVVEMQGPNSRVCYPFRRIEKLRGRTSGESVTRSHGYIGQPYIPHLPRLPVLRSITG